jgi:hypothetical protein
VRAGSQLSLLLQRYPGGRPGPPAPGQVPGTKVLQSTGRRTLRGHGRGRSKEEEVETKRRKLANHRPTSHPPFPPVLSRLGKKSQLSAVAGYDWPRWGRFDKRFVLCSLHGLVVFEEWWWPKRDAAFLVC